MLKKVLVSTVVISSTIFASFLLLLAMQGSKPIKIQVENQEIFYGELRDIVSPSVGAAFSLGLGLASAVVVGWQQSIRQSSELEKQLSNLQKRISEKESEIEVLKLPAYRQLSQQPCLLEEKEQN